MLDPPKKYFRLAPGRTVRLRGGYCITCTDYKQDAEGCLLYTSEAVKKAFELHGSDIAAVIREPFPANAGLYFPQNDFLHFLREITLRHDALLILSLIHI